MIAPDNLSPEQWSKVVKPPETKTAHAYPPRCESNPVPKGTDVPPGAKRIRVFRERVENGEQLWADDERFEEETPLKVVTLTADVLATEQAENGRTAVILKPNRNGQNSEAAMAGPCAEEKTIEVIRLSVRKRRRLAKQAPTVTTMAEAAGLAKRIWGSDAVAWLKEGVYSIGLFRESRLGVLGRGRTWLEAFDIARGKRSNP